jgi:cyclopropane fatty-acyl-phospholipid synthase-like methyltransferase
MTLPYATIFAILKKISLTPSDVVLDIGCGKGRMICCAALFPVREVIGIEHSPELCANAAQNASRLRHKCSPITIKNERAEHFDFGGINVFYFYNSFGPPLLDEVLARIERALQDNPRPIRFIYANPVHEASLKACSWLEQFDEISPLQSRSMAVRVTFWRSRPAAYGAGSANEAGARRRWQNSA